jgi:hypothetical protein
MSRWCLGTVAVGAACASLDHVDDVEPTRKQWTAHRLRTRAARTFPMQVYVVMYQKQGDVQRGWQQ